MEPTEEQKRNKEANPPILQERVENLQKMENIFQSFLENHPSIQELEFFYVRYQFSGRPLGIKKELTDVASYFHTFGRAAKKYEKGNIYTFLECFGSQTNLKWLHKGLMEVSNMHCLEMIEINRKRVLLNIAYIKKLPVEIREFLVSKNSIEETPFYMKRPNSIFSSRQEYLGEEKSLSNVTTEQNIIQEPTTKMKRALTMSITNIEERFSAFTLKFVGKSTEEDAYIAHEIPPNKLKETQTSAPTLQINREGRLEVQCSLLGKERSKYFYLMIYPTEPPTTVYPKIKEMFPDFEWEDIILFDEYGNELNHNLELQEIESRNFIFYFRPLVADYEKKNPEVSAILRGYDAIHELCMASEQNIGFDKFKILLEGHLIDDWFKNSQANLRLVQLELAMIEKERIGDKH